MASPLRLLDELLELAPTARAERLAAIAADDRALGAELGRLLAAAERNEGPTERLRAEVAAIAEWGLLGGAEEVRPPERLGAWRLTELLGRGGMGEVWRGERSEGGFAQVAAIKIVRAGMASDGIVERFRLERQLLARLDHPAIARLLDGGIAPDGRPWFAMELVAGKSITAYAREARLDLERRLELLIAVAGAVDVAHRSLVVHRDLKPSNILVTAAGEPKLLDFGLAKLLEPELDPGLTRTEMRALTPSYAAPEQVTGEPVTTATDVYALGVLLYELLTGELPHRRAAASAAGLVEEVARETVERPSSRLRRTRGPGPETATAGAAKRPGPLVPRQLEGDLDTIALRALAREPARRYPSAAAFADDLRRYLDGRPVAARPDSAGYRLAKFVGRHRLGVAAAFAVVASLVAGLSVALVQAQRARAAAVVAERESARARAEAERAREEVRSSFDQMSFFVSILQQASPTMRKSAEMPSLLDAIRDGETRVETTFAPEQADDAARIYLSLSVIELALGDRARAQPMVERAYELTRGPHARDPVLAAEANRNLGELHRQARRWERAEELFREGHQRIERYLATTDPADVDPQAYTVAANLASFVGQTMHERGRSAAAIPFLERAIELKRRYEAEDSHVTGISYYHLAQMQAASGRAVDGEKNIAHAIALHEKNLEPADPRLIFVLGAGVEIAVLAGDSALALTRAERAMAIAEAAFDRPTRPLGIAQLRLGEALAAAGRREEAQHRLRAARETAAAVGANREVGQAEVALGALAADSATARAHLEAARALFAGYYEADHPARADLELRIAALP